MISKSLIINGHKDGFEGGLLPTMPTHGKTGKEATTPDRSTAAAFPRCLCGEVVADSVALQGWGFYARGNLAAELRLTFEGSTAVFMMCCLRG
jgi:hypothetical protein